MRNSLVTTLFGLSLVACAGQIDAGGGGGGGGDDDVSASCGDGVVDQGEGCDDGNLSDGDGCSATCSGEASPRLDVNLDKPTVNTELGTSTMLTVTLAAADGFEGDVTVTPSIVDANSQPIDGWLVTSPQTVSVAQDGTANVVVTVAIPSDSATLQGTVKLDVTSSLGAQSVSSAFTAANQVTLTIGLVNGECQYPPGTFKVRVGTVLRFFNNSANEPLVVHSNDNAQNGRIPHQGPGGDQSPDDPVTESQTAYARTVGGGERTFSWYCHSPGPDLGGDNPRISVVQ